MLYPAVMKWLITPVHISLQGFVFRLPCQVYNLYHNVLTYQLARGTGIQQQHAVAGDYLTEYSSTSISSISFIHGYSTTVGNAGVEVTW